MTPRGTRRPDGPPIRLLVAASSPLIRAGLRAVLADEPGMVVVDATSLDEALLDRAADLAADALLVAVDADERDAVSTLATRGAAAGPPIVALADDPRALWRIAGDGLRAVLPRDAGVAEIAAAIVGAAVGLVVLHPSALEAGAATPPAHGDHALTARETEILGMLAEGHANKTVASRLGISEHTVKFHVASIFEKLGVSTRTEAVTTAIRRGLLLL